MCGIIIFIILCVVYYIPSSLAAVMSPFSTMEEQSGIKKPGMFHRWEEL